MLEEMQRTMFEHQSHNLAISSISFQDQTSIPFGINRGSSIGLIVAVLPDDLIETFFFALVAVLSKIYSDTTSLYQQIVIVEIRIR